MKLEIYREKEPEQENIVRLRLMDGSSGIFLTAVDKNGDVVGGGFLARITTSGTLKLSSNVSEEIGLQLDGHGRIIIE